MPKIDVDPRLVAIAIQEMPLMVAGIRALFAKDHPDDPQPTEADVYAALGEAKTAALTRSDAWLAAHPEPPPAA